MIHYVQKRKKVKNIYKNNRTLIITVGAPGSGKSTWAVEYAKTHEHVVLLSRDDFRKMITGSSLTEYKYKKSTENTITRMVTESVVAAFSNPLTQTVIVHDTNLRESTRKSFYDIAQEYNLAYKEQLFDVPLAVLLKRNLHRGEKSVPESVIRNMYSRFREYAGVKPVSMNTNNPKTVIFDVDGTLVTMGDRSPYEWDKVDRDHPNHLVIQLYMMYYQKGYECIIVSGRDGSCREKTFNHLRQYVPIQDSDLYMREAGDSRPDYIVKEEILHKLAEKYNVILAIDDRNSVVDMWRENGITCFQVAPGDF